MAKKKKAVSRPRRRARVGSIMNLGGKAGNLLTLTGGGIAGGLIVNMLGNTVADKVSPTVLSGGKLVLGMMVAAKAKNPFVQGAGIGAMITGGTELARSTGMMAGMTNPFLSAYSGGTYALSGVEAPESEAVEAGEAMHFDATTVYIP